jgi:hypothetical protein
MIANGIQCVFSLLISFRFLYLTNAYVKIDISRYTAIAFPNNKIISSVFIMIDDEIFLLSNPKGAMLSDKISPVFNILAYNSGGSLY